MPIKKFTALLLALAIWSCSGDRTNREIVVGDTLTTESGAKYIYTRIGTGRPVETGSKVWTYLALEVNGKEIWNTNGPPDSSFVFVAGKDRMIKGFTEVTLKLREGDEVIAILPPELAYGEKGAGSDIPPNATLVYTQYKMKKVNEPKLSLSDTLFAAMKSGGIRKMVDTRHRILNSADTSKYYYDNSQYRILWNLLNDAGLNEENLQLIDFINTKNESGWRWYRVRTYEKLGKFSVALDSLNVLMASDTSMASNGRAVQLKAELESKVTKK
ncbi:MAG: FKBP-type peptidyl-prolyl cis-trans isomerase [Cyclobacteriaceae bacterium]|nr:FKBP-type peptidyl-prolyl cis-trans isomerase [Cyclobacteriaceae bacterium]